MTENRKSCFLCGAPACDTHHLISGTANRRLSEKYGLTVPICRRCHNLVHTDPHWNLASKKFGQKKWEEKYGTREEFIKAFGKSWLDKE